VERKNKLWKIPDLTGRPNLVQHLGTAQAENDEKNREKIALGWSHLAGKYCV